MSNEKGKKIPPSFPNMYQLMRESVAKIERGIDRVQGPAKPAIFALFDNPQFQVFMANSPSFVCVYNILECQYEYFSPNLKRYTGYDPEEMVGKESLNKAHSLVKPEHVEVNADKLYPLFFQYLAKCRSGAASTDLRMLTTMQIKKKTGEYFWALCNTSFIAFNEQGMPTMTLVFFTDISSLKKDDILYHTFLDLTEDGVYVPVYQSTTPETDMDFMLSKREIQILQLLAQGMRTPKIAQHLFISENTVSTHRKNMLSKTKMKTMNELIRSAMMQGMI